MQREDFLGAWQLQCWTVTTNNQVRYPFGEDVRGLLMYTDDGYMSAVINKAEKMRVPAGSTRHFSSEIKAQLFDCCFTYAGTWRLDKHVVIHQVLCSHNPNFINTEQFRDAVFKNDTLTLSASEKIVGKGTRSHALIWKRP